MQKTVISDFHESGWQNMLKKSADKFHRIQRHVPETIASDFFIPEGDRSVLNLYDSAVGDGSDGGAELKRIGTMGGAAGNYSLNQSCAFF